MIKKIAITSLLSLALSTSLFSQELYVKLGLGTSSVDSNVKGVNFSGESILTLAIGTKIQEFDIELEYTYEKNKWRNVDTNVNGTGKTNNLMINGFYNLNLDSDFTPYAGLGLGSAKFDSGENDETYFVYQAMLGVNYALTKEFDLGLEYRYKDTNSDNDLSSNNILFVTKYKF
ncbi:MAG: porin family protein [Campylobacteraceae bacterium]|nr:porin family protein [Campylobacteraceae bacterium]